MTNVYNSGGPVNTGSGPQFVFTFDDIFSRHVRNFRTVPLEDLRWLKRRFVSPPNLGAARRRLQATRLVLLAGRPGSGRRTAAKMLLNELVDENSPFTVLDDEAHDAGENLGSSNVDFGHRLLLDLSYSNDEIIQARQRELPSFRAVLQEHDAFLAVVVPDVSDLPDGDLADYVVPIGRPAADLVLRRHLEAMEIYPEVEDLGGKELAPHLAAPMRDIAGLARLVAQARDGNRSAGVSTWLSEAISAVDRSREVVGQMKQHTSGRARAVLLAAAMCQHSSTDAVFFSSHRMIQLLNLDKAENPRMEQDGYQTHLKMLKIDVTANNRTLFSRFAYGRAVRNHFWDNYPDLREVFRDWVGEIIRLPQFTRKDRERLVERFVEQALRTANPEHVVFLISRWVSPGPNDPKYLVELGARALLLGLQEERHGWRFRRLVYDWSRDESLSPQVGQLVVEACTEVIALNFPEQALVRLRHRARREDGSGNPTARQAIWELTENNRVLLRRWLIMLAEKLRQPGRWLAADAALFLDAAAPWWRADLAVRVQVLVTDAVLRPCLVIGWYRAMTSRPDIVRPAVHGWLAVAGQVVWPDPLLAILVEAASYHVGLLGALHVAARDWSQDRPGSHEVAARLSHLIDMAQGIHPADYFVHRTPEEAVR